MSKRKKTICLLRYTGKTQVRITHYLCHLRRTMKTTVAVQKKKGDLASPRALERRCLLCSYPADALLHTRVCKPAFFFFDLRI